LTHPTTEVQHPFRWFLKIHKRYGVAEVLAKLVIESFAMSKVSRPFKEGRKKEKAQLKNRLIIRKRIGSLSLGIMRFVPVLVAEIRPPYHLDF